MVRWNQSAYERESFRQKRTNALTVPIQGEKESKSTYTSVQNSAGIEFAVETHI